MSSDNTNLLALVEKMHQFLCHQIEHNSQLSEAAQESLTVAIECIEQAYKIQKKPASSELMDIYMASLQSSNSAPQGSFPFAMPQTNNPAQFIQNLASTILSSASAAATGRGGQAASTNSSATDGAPPASSKPKKVRKTVSEAEKQNAEKFKNQGNEYMKQDKYRDAYECYTQAISIDDNNAIYYSNRAAASSKLGDHNAALTDCQEAVEIDPSYGKAYGRMALAYASLEDHQKARDAYVKAVELDPYNESYRNNLKIAEEKLAEQANANNSGGQNNMMSIVRSMMSNPEVMQIAMRSLQDPRFQSLLGMGGSGGNVGGGGAGGVE